MPFSAPHGVPLSEEIMSFMLPEDRNFWEDFLKQGMKEVLEAEQRNETLPYTPSQELREKYFRAVDELGGGHYCQVIQFRRVFDF